MSSSQSRHVYTREQRTILEASFARQSHPDIQEKERLAKLFNCNLIQISNWFQNHRRRVKKMKKSTTPSVSPPTVPYDHTPTYPSYTCHQPDCPFICHSEAPPVYYYYPATSPYVYSPPSYASYYGQ